MDQNHTPQEYFSLTPASDSSESSESRGYQDSPRPLYEDTTLTALKKQVRQLVEIEAILVEVGQTCSQVRRALSALAPALEVHMHGLRSEASRWQKVARQAEDKYAEAFEGLEEKMGALHQHLDHAEKRLQEQHQQELSKLRSEAESLRKALAQIKKPDLNGTETSISGEQDADSASDVFEL